MRIIRKILKDHKTLYNLASKVYHLTSEVLMSIFCKLNNVVYLKPIKARGKYKSQFGQDYYLCKLGLLKKNGFFIEIGANDPKYNSNTYFLEKQFMYRGISIDALDYSKEFKLLRPRTKFYKKIVDKFRGIKKIYSVFREDGWEDQMSSIYKKNLKTGKTFKAKIIKVKSAPLKDFIPKRKVDILLIDVEGHELNVLSSVNFKKFRPDVILIENNSNLHPRDQLTKFMKNNSYRLHYRIGLNDDIYLKM